MGFIDYTTFKSRVSDTISSDVKFSDHGDHYQAIYRYSDSKSDLPVYIRHYHVSAEWIISEGIHEQGEGKTLDQALRKFRIACPGVI